MKISGTVKAQGEWIAQAARWGQRALPERLNVSTRLVPSRAGVGRGVLTAPGMPNASSVIASILFLGGVLFLGLSSHAQSPAAKVATSGPGKDFKFPDYYPSSNGVRQLKTLVTGSEAHFVSNN